MDCIFELVSDRDSELPVDLLASIVFSSHDTCRLVDDSESWVFVSGVTVPAIILLSLDGPAVVKFSKSPIWLR
jgi:hypothetical protein